MARELESQGVDYQYTEYGQAGQCNGGHEFPCWTPAATVALVVALSASDMRPDLDTLDAIGAATERLVITYSGFHESTGQERPPSVPLRSRSASTT